MGAVIMLASKYNPKKQKFPVHVSEKYDGVAADFFKVGRTWQVRSRQNKPIKSVDHIIRCLNKRLPNAIDGTHLVGELYIPGRDFKEISGIVRRDAEAPEVFLYIYDMYDLALEHQIFADRFDLLTRVCTNFSPDDPMGIPHYVIADTPEDVERIKSQIIAGDPEAEGLMIRQLNGPGSTYQVGKRPSGMAKYKLVETVDLEIHSIEEAVDKEGKPKGMLGRLNVLYKGTVIGCGPGKLVHGERYEMFVNQEDYIGKTVEVAYMPDASYDALREPRVLRLRPDKD